MNIKINKKNIKKFCALAAGATITLSTLSGCGNKDMWDTNYTFTHAVIIEQGKTTIVPIKQWSDYDGEQIQIIMEDGNIFLTSTFNTKLFSEKNGSLTAEDFAISISPSENEIGYIERQDTSKVMKKTNK